jgi:DNA gyrase subunit B
MRPLIEAGYVYIAQPPLYKIAKGKKVQYCYSDEELERWFQENAAEGITVYSEPDKKAITGEELTDLLNKLMRYRYFYNKFQKRGLPAELINACIKIKDAMIGIPVGPAILKNELTKIVPGVEVYYKTDKDGAAYVEVKGIFDGKRKEVLIDSRMIESLELDRLHEIYREIKSSYRPPFVIQGQNGKKVLARSIDELLNHLLSSGKKGVTVQRYKGLGEMNPKQLWETTMNPETRTVLKVTLEDAMKADEIFTILMGDKVEPRREFIETHAKEVRVLDI